MASAAMPDHAARRADAHHTSDARRRSELVAEMTAAQPAGAGRRARRHYKITPKPGTNSTAKREHAESE
jgi:hypothetical protein